MPSYHLTTIGRRSLKPPSSRILHLSSSNQLHVDQLCGNG